MYKIENDPRIFKIPPYSFESSTSYSITVTTSVKDDTRFSTSTIYLNVLKGNIKAIIKGGNLISSSINELIEIDASLSRDEDKALSNNDNLYYGFMQSGQTLFVNESSGMGQTQGYGGF